MDLRLVVWTVGLLVTLGLAHNLCGNSGQVITITITQLSQAIQLHRLKQRQGDGYLAQAQMNCVN